MTPVAQKISLDTAAFAEHTAHTVTAECLDLSLLSHLLTKLMNPKMQLQLAVTLLCLNRART